LAALISYTFSKSLDNEGGNIDNQSATQNDNDPNAEYALSDFNAKHTLVVSSIYELPFGSGKRFLSNAHYANLFAGGWEISAIVSAHSGLPFTITSAQDYSNTNSSSPRPDRICNGAGPNKITEWFNTGCFTTTALAQALANGTPRFGNAGRNVLLLPGLQNWDLAFIKKTTIRDRLAAEFKAEFFNAFNHTNLGAPGSVIGTQTAGVISSSGSPRDVQLAIKLEF
jgi:hypothetical protein